MRWPWLKHYRGHLEFARSFPNILKEIIVPGINRFPSIMILLPILISACTTPRPLTEAPEPGAIDSPIPTITSLPATLIPTPTITITQPPTVTENLEPVPLPAFETSACKFNYNYPAEVECGYLIVPENRGKPDSPPIRIHVAIFKSTNPNPKPDPVIYVAGGGGTDQLSSSDLYLNQVGNAILQERDFIMYNQRGANFNQPTLVCPDLTILYWELAKQDLNPHENADQRIEKRLECYNSLLARGIDLTAYNTVETAADINDLRNVLGLEEVNLYGTSSGTRTILTVLRNHPEGIRSVILDSVFPPQVYLYSTVALSVNRVFSLLFEGCAADPGCSQRYPDLEATFYRVIDDLNANPASVELSGGTVFLTGDMFMEALYLSFYSVNDIGLAPGRIYSASKGIYTGMMPWFDSLLSDTGPFMAMGFEWSMMCNEEVPFESYELGRELAAGLPPQIATYFDSYYEFTLCESWQSGKADPVENTAVASDIPALVLAGQYDLVTPPEWGRMAAETLSKHYYFEFPGLTHGIMRSNACGLEIGLQFINDPSSEPDSSCIKEIPAIDFR
jgi:pimeloyl-ACP methyl ester carboxylesterase